jgi:hypothetical protein
MASITKMYTYLLVVILFLGVGLGWYCDHGQQQRKIRQAYFDACYSFMSTAATQMVQDNDKETLDVLPLDIIYEQCSKLSKEYMQ